MEEQEVTVNAGLHRAVENESGGQARGRPRPRRLTEGQRRLLLKGQKIAGFQAANAVLRRVIDSVAILHWKHAHVFAAPCVALIAEMLEVIG